MTNKERKLKARSRWKIIPPSQEAKPYTQKFAEQVRSFSLARLNREVKKNAGLRRDLISEFREWKQTTNLTYIEWPDLPTYLTAKSVAKILATEFQSRKVPCAIADSIFADDLTIFADALKLDELAEKAVESYRGVTRI